MTSVNAPESLTSADATVGQNVHLILWSRGMKQREFAARLGISDSVLSKRLRGTSAWSAQDVADVAALLDVQPGRLFEQVTRPYPLLEIAASTDNPRKSTPNRPLMRLVPTP